MNKQNLFRGSVMMLAFIFSIHLSGQGTIAGTITEESGEPLIGANIIVAGSTEGTITDFDGTFSFTTSESFPLKLLISFTGFNSQEIVLDGPSSSVDVILLEGIIFGDDIVISASRKREKVQEAPASISIITARKLEGTAQTNPVRQLVAMPGVQIQQQSAGRINIEMRASSGIFGTSVFPIKDYRSLVAPGIGVFQSDQAGLSTIDLQRIEVVRGPGSALYGPGVTSGVVHFITKNPIDFPGTTVQVYGGEMNTFGGAVRHAGANESRTFGYKINVSGNRGDEFKLDGSEGTISAAGEFESQLSKFRNAIYRPNVTANGQIDPSQLGTQLLTLEADENGNVMADKFENISTDLTLEFRPSDDLNVTLAGGFTSASAVFYNDLGEGLAQSKEMWYQARMQFGGLFAQVFYVDNDGGDDNRPTFLYQTGNKSSIARKQLEGQLQYNFGMPDLLDADWTVGVDFRKAISDTGNLTYGKNEAIDKAGIVGAYAQGKFALGDKLDMVLAGRYDNFNFIDQDFFSPRVAFVYKASPKHTFRASWNRASAPPSGLETYVDFPVNVPVAGVFDFWLAGQNNIQEFGDNPMIEFLNQSVVAQGIAAATGLPIELIQPVADLLPDELSAAGLGTAGLDNSFIHDVATQAFLGQLVANGLGALVTPMSQYLAANAISGNNGLFYGVNAFENNSPLNSLIPTNNPALRIQSTYEVGYKGLFGDKLGMSLDIYRQTESGFSDFTQIAPLITLQGANTDEFTALAGGIAQQLIGAGIPAASAAALAGAYGQTAALIPNFYGTGTVETNQVPQDDGILHVAAGYRIFPDAKSTYWGSDLGLEYYVNDDFSIFGNYSWISKTEFRAEDLNEPADSPLARFLNVPKNKFRIGWNYTPSSGFRANMVFQHDDSFEASVGQYSGPTDVKNIVDAGFGYKFGNGLAIDVTAQNLFDSNYRTFTNMPVIGRRALFRLTYDFGAE